MKLSTFLAFGAGALSFKALDYYQLYFGQQKSYSTHSFTEQMKQKNFEQPKVIDLMHNSDQMHFLHNFIIQSELNVINFIKVYFPKGIDSKVLGGEINNMSEEEKKKYLQCHLIFNASDHVQAHKGIVHGGLLATLFDNTFAYLGMASSGLNPIATVYLNITYKKPVKINKDYKVTCELEKAQGRKIFMKGQIIDIEGNVCTEAEALFLKVDWGQANWKKMHESLSNKLGITQAQKE